jgi:putative transcriptional regulator
MHTQGSLLLAAPLLDDPNFHRSVIYMLQHSVEGALGLVINQPTEEDHVNGLHAWFQEASSPGVVFSGGPVATDTLIALATLDPRTESDTVSPISGSLASVDLSQSPQDVIDDLRHLRLFRGYSGWGAGQLEAELAEGSWLVMPTDPLDIFTPNPQGLWRNVLRRNAGPKAWLADAPDDLSWN